MVIGLGLYVLGFIACAFFLCAMRVIDSVAAFAGNEGCGGFALVFTLCALWPLTIFLFGTFLVLYEKPRWEEDPSEKKSETKNE